VEREETAGERDGVEVGDLPGRTDDGPFDGDAPVGTHDPVEPHVVARGGVAAEPTEGDPRPVAPQSEDDPIGSDGPDRPREDDPIASPELSGREGPVPRVSVFGGIGGECPVSDAETGEEYGEAGGDGDA
jgi:hypothetical protein